MMKIHSYSRALPLLALLVAGVYVATSNAQNQFPADQPPADSEERVEVVIPDTGGVIRRQLDLIAPSEEPSLVQRSPFAGKVVLLQTVNSLYPPYENVQIESVAGHSFFVIEGSDDSQPAFQFWLAVDKVESIRVFNHMREAERFLGAGQNGR